MMKGMVYILQIPLAERAGGDQQNFKLELARIAAGIALTRPKLDETGAGKRETGPLRKIPNQPTSLTISAGAA
jgi:hypothetical protein